MINQDEWNALHSEKRFRPKYPEDDIVRWLFSNVPRNSKVLDDGCGAGRHIILLAENGYIPFGIDYSNNGVEYTKQLLNINNHDEYIDNVFVASCDDLPFEDCFFDGLISYGVLYYLEDRDIKKAVDEIYRVLKKNGKTVVVVRSTEDYRNNTNLINTTQNIISIKDKNLSGNAENGMSEHFFTRTEIENLFSDFSSLTIDRIIRTHNNEEICDNDYIIFAEK